MSELRFYLSDWGAVAPGLDNASDWQSHLENRTLSSATDSKPEFPAIKRIPAMLRRRFGLLGKCAAQASMDLLESQESEVPIVFASRHGDTALSLSLLKGIGLEQAMSPTDFSLAVHNAVSGLMSIARKDTSPVTAIAASHDLLLQALFESLGLLQDSPRVLCIVYDVPLPELYSSYTNEIPYPYAVAMLLDRDKGTELLLSRQSNTAATRTENFPEGFAPLLLATGLSRSVALSSEGEADSWHLSLP